MKKIKTLLIVVISILGLGAGISKVLLLPEELAFFQKVGLTNTAIIMVGILQVIGAVLIFITRFRKIGATLLGITFGVSSILIFMSGDMAFGLFSILPIAFIFFIAKPEKK